MSPIQTRNMRASISSWDSVRRDNWSMSREDMIIQTFGFALSSLPDFSEPRFAYLAKDADARISKVVQLQQQMLRQIHSLGRGWATSLRIIKDENVADGLVLHLLFRHAGKQPLGQREISQAVASVSSSLMNNEYSFVPDTHLPEAMGTSWVNEIADILRPEREYKGAPYPDGTPPQEFYVPFSWVPVENRMQVICDALMRHSGKASVEITLVPTEYLTDERDWVGVSIDLLREAMNGETIRDEKTGRILWQAEKLPVLRDAVDSMEKMEKQYEMSQMFLSSIHVLAESGCSALADALVANSVKSRAQKIVYDRSSPWFKLLATCYETVDVPASLVSPYWMRNTKRGTVPFRAQRLTRLVSLEEASTFFRIPISVRPDFPGFSIDTGLGDGKIRKPQSSGLSVGVGRYLDETGTSTDATFSAQQLAKHGMVVGVPGSGKTTAMFGLLNQLWDTNAGDRIPFLVLEPAKTEYRALSSLPAFAGDMLVFTLGDEDTSPFRFNPMEVPDGIRLESHISKLQACFVGAFDLFDPLPMFLETAIRRTYEEKGWYDDSKGGDPGTEVPTLSDLCRNATYIINHSGFEQKMRDNFQASLIERLNSLRRGSKGRMLDCRKTIPPEDLMGRPVIIELDSLNASEKSLMMMFLLSYVFEYCKMQRTSGSPIRHLMVVEEAHNLIPSGGSGGESHRGNPKEHTIELFTNMLAEMRALGEGIVIVDQLPTAVAPQAVKQTNVKILMRVTAKDDREAIGNTMDLNDEQMHQVVNFKTGHAYLYHEGEDRVRMIRLPNFKGENNVEEPPSDAQLKSEMSWYEKQHPDLYLPFPQCNGQCNRCDRRTRSQAETFVRNMFQDSNEDVYHKLFPDVNGDDLRERANMCNTCMLLAKREANRIRNRYGTLGLQFGACCFIHMENMVPEQMSECESTRMKGKCSCSQQRQAKVSGITKVTREA